MAYYLQEFIWFSVFCCEKLRKQIIISLKVMKDYTKEENDKKNEEFIA